jgi:hypothetical protein
MTPYPVQPRSFSNSPTCPRVKRSYRNSRLYPVQRILQPLAATVGEGSCDPRRRRLRVSLAHLRAGARATRCARLLVVVDRAGRVELLRAAGREVWR